MRLALVAALLLALAGAAVAQPFAGDPPTRMPVGGVLLVNPTAVLERSRTGQALIRANRLARERLVAEGEQISSDFEREERALAARRSVLSRDEFAEIAAEFDERVRAARAEQDRRAAQLTREEEERERAFAESLNPIYAEIMRDTGAAAILDLRDVILANTVLDITAEVIRRLDTRQLDQGEGED